MSFLPLERIPLHELEIRHERARAMLTRHAPGADGIMAFSRVQIYHFAGSMVDGLFWLPRQGEPALLIRRGLERARLECPLANILPFRSYSDIPGVCDEAGSPLGKTVAAEMSGLPWSLANLLQAKIEDTAFVPGDAVLARTRAVKTEWELRKIRLAGARHDETLRQRLPKLIHPGMSERAISHKAWDIFFSLGHGGLMRMNSQEIFLGHVAAGDSANYPSVFNGPVGLRGEHPAMPVMGYAGKIWKPDEPLVCDIGFSLEGYQTDKTQVYWPGSRKSLPDELARAHDFCVSIQAQAAERLRPGAIPSQIWAECLQRAQDEGMAEGFMALDGNKVVFLGHGVGLHIDEYPVLAKGFDEPLEQGMVIALEPKHGIPGVGMVGVENTFEVTEHGGQCLTGREFDVICLEDC